MLINNYKDKLNGRYEVEEELSNGPFGVVLRAIDTHAESRPVVIKTLPAAGGDARDNNWLRRKFDEQILALDKIKHPGVVRAYAYGWTPEGKPFFVMPFIEGERLRDVVGGGALELKRAAHIVGQLGAALGAAHDVGVIHRDLKPENVILQTSEGEEFAVLIDFGIATVVDLEGGRRAQQTRVVGTLPYMAPEQLRGGPPVPASDVWALGVVGYEMVTGKLPFDADDILTLDDMQREGVRTAPRSLRPELPEAAQQVILKALSYDPAARYPHAREMGEAFLSAVLSGEAPTLPHDYPPELRRQTAPPAPESLKELLRRCRKLFKSLDEFGRPDSLRGYLRLEGLDASLDCVRNAAEVDFNQLLDCLYRSGREYRGQSLLDLLAALATTYREDHRGQESEGLRCGLKQLLERPPAAGR